MAGKPKHATLFDFLIANLSIPKGNECWEWTGCLGSHGYGVGSFHREHLTSHRTAYMVLIGPIPDGSHVLHRCDNRKCCRPDHLFLGDQHSNNADKIGKRRHSFGERTRTNKLTISQVDEIQLDTKKQHEIAARYGVNQSVISRIKSGKAWRIAREHSVQ